MCAWACFVARCCRKCVLVVRIPGICCKLSEIVWVHWGSSEIAGLCFKLVEAFGVLACVCMLSGMLGHRWQLLESARLVLEHVLYSLQHARLVQVCVDRGMQRLQFQACLQHASEFKSVLMVVCRGCALLACSGCSHLHHARISARPRVAIGLL